MRFKDAWGYAIELSHTVLVFIIVSCLWIVCSAAFVSLVVISFKFMWVGAELVVNSFTYSAILKSPDATATLVGVVITGFFGFGGIILTNALSARAAREQYDLNERRARSERDHNELMAREIQIDIAKGMDKRIKEFADAFAKYHTETLAALKKE